MWTSARAIMEAVTLTLRVRINQAASHVHVTSTTWATDSLASVGDPFFLLQRSANFSILLSASLYVSKRGAY